MARGDRFVALGLAHARSNWFGDVARWSNSAALPLEFVKCVTVEEVRTRFRTGRPFSALLIDSRVSGLDRDLVDEATSHACAVIVVDDARVRRDWPALGATAVLSDDFGPDELLDALESFAVRIGIAETPMADPTARAAAAWRGHLVAVTGPGGTGASSVAMAIAQGLAADVRLGGLVALADLALDADQAMLHDAGDVVPGVQELVEAHRNGQPTSTEIRALTFAVGDRGYDLLLGLRRHRDWVTIRPRAFDAALDSLLRSYKAVVADITSDFEGERHCGSIDVEERNVMARTTAAAADVVVVVGSPGPRGVHRMVRLVAALVDVGIDGERILPVVNRAPRSPRSRAEITAALNTLSHGVTTTATPLPTPIFVPDRRRFDDLVHVVGRLPDGLVTPLTTAVRVMLDRTPARSTLEASREQEPVAVTPGSLGQWYDEEAG